VVKRINHEADGRFVIGPANTMALCSTPVPEMYETDGYRILPAELVERRDGLYLYDEENRPNPWVVVERIGRSSGDWRSNPFYVRHAHPATRRIWSLYNLGDRVRMLLNDSIPGDDGDLT